MKYGTEDRTASVGAGRAKRGGWTALALLGMIVAGGVASVDRAVAVDDVPNMKVLVFPAYMPKNGVMDMGAYPAGYWRELYGNTYEGFWRETSYYRSNPTNGLPVRGLFLDTKTYGETAMTWPMGLSGAVPIASSNAAGTTVSGVLTYSGKLPGNIVPTGEFEIRITGGTRDLVLTDATRTGDLTGDGTGHLNYGSGDYSFTLNTTPPQGGSIAITYATAIAGGMNAPGGWVNLGPDRHFRPDGRGEMNFEILPGGGDGQMYGGKGALLDGYWTPGERFHDNVVIDGRWTAAISNENRWVCNNTLGTVNGRSFTPAVKAVASSLIKTNGTWDAKRGEYYLDYNFDTYVDATTTRVTTVGFSTNVWLYMAVSGSNVPVCVSEFDIPKGVGVVQTNFYPGIGDFSHTAINDWGPPPPGPIVDVPTNKVFDFEVDGAGAPLVYRASSINNSSQMVDWVYTTYLNIPNDFINMGGRLAANGVDVYPLPGDGWIFEPANGSTYMGTNAFAGASGDLTLGLCKLYRIHVPVYQAGELFGQNLFVPYIYNDGYTEATNGNIYNDGPFMDDVWTPGKPAEEFEDFISWWMPDAGDDVPVPKGRWVVGVAGVPHLVGGSGVTDDPFSTLNWGQYSSYVSNNYPGNVQALLDRCCNGTYDGPDSWADSCNNKMQRFGYLDPTVLIGAPPGLYGVSGWDPYMIYGGTWQGWWTSQFSAWTAGSAPGWISMIPDVTTWGGNPGSVATVTTNPISGTVTTNGPWYPPKGTTWGYDSPREFEDMPSSLYHRLDCIGNAGEPGGDGRLGEITSPWNSTSLYGVDYGKNNPVGANIPPENPPKIPTAGPWAYNINGVHGVDAGNVMSFELLTWRTDGQYLTGPRSVHAAAGRACVRPPGSHFDHRDVNLDGLIDQGESVPPNCWNYFEDDDSMTPNNGMDTHEIFGWERLMEDVIEAWDVDEDFSDVMFNNGAAGADIPVFGPTTWNWAASSGRPMTAYVTYSCAWKTNELIGAWPHPEFNYAMDSFWIDYNDNQTYDVETVLSGDSSAVANGVVGTALPRARYLNIGGAAGFDVASDFAWNDNLTLDNRFTTDLVLGDQSRLLRVGQTGRAITWIQPGVRVYYQDVGTTPGSPDEGDNFWIENRVTNTPIVAVYDTVSTGGDWVIYVGTSGMFTNGAPGVDITASIYYTSRQSGDVGWFFGDDIWCENPAVPGGVAGVYNAEEPISAPLGLSFKRASYEPGAAMSAAYRDLAVAGYQQANDVAWFDTDSDAVYDAELAIVDHGLKAGDVGARLAPGTVAWVDTPGTNGLVDGQYTAPYHEVVGDAEFTYGDAFWIDVVPNGRYDVGRQLPIYAFARYLGGADPGIYHSGNGFGALTRDGVYIGGGNQCNSANLGLGLPTHEQGHDFPGWPDLYDYDRYLADYQNMPVGGRDLYSNGGLVHNYPDMKMGYYPGMQPQNLKDVIGKQNGGVKTVLMYPVERVADQYYYFTDPSGVETYWFHYLAGVSTYDCGGGRGLYIDHTDYSSVGMTGPGGRPIQQRINGRFTWAMVQADGLFEMEDGLSGVTPEDVFGSPSVNPPVKLFTESTQPPSRWFNQADTGLRVVDIRLPADPLQPIEVDMEWVTITGKWFWVESGDDKNGNGIPDAWEQYWFSALGIDPLTAVTATSDYDGDGLTDYEEWIGRLNPRFQWSWTTNVTTVSDADGDCDGDGLSNVEEIRWHKTNIWEPDTDDDGISDRVEINAAPGKATSPIDSRSPLVERSLHLTATDKLWIPSWEANDWMRFQLPSWTLEAWVRLDGASETGLIISRVTSQGSTNFMLGVSNNVPYAGYVTDGGSQVRVTTKAGFAPFAAGVWHHVAGVWDDSLRSLCLYVDGTINNNAVGLERPPVGRLIMKEGKSMTGTAYLGGNLSAFIDEIRVWSSARTASQVFTEYNSIINSPWVTNAVPPLTKSVGNDGTLVCNLRFDDGQNVSITNRVDNTVHSFGAEDYVHTRDWDYAVTPLGNATFSSNAGEYVALRLSETILPPIDDLNEDGIADSWYALYWPNLSGGDGYGDPDGDGLSNYQESRAGTDPFVFDTDANGIDDYDSRSNVNSRTYGEMYSDGDEINDGWEVQYRTACSPLIFDAHVDPDFDGWNNRSEYLAGTSPDDRLNYPLPLVRLSVRYDGLRRGGNVMLFAYGDSSMDGAPKATFDLGAMPLTTTPGEIVTLMATNAATGHLSQGNTWFLAFIDNDGSGTPDTGEPFGLPQDEPIYVGWDAVPITIGLSDSVAGFGRFSWPDTGADTYTISINCVNLNSNVVTTVIHGPKNFFHEGDYRRLGMPRGLPSGGLSRPWYEWFVDNISGGYFTNAWATPAAPLLQWPLGATLRLERNEFMWKSDKTNTQFQLQIAAGAAAGPVVFDKVLSSPFRDGAGMYRYVLPVYAGEEIIVTNVTHYWRVRAITPTVIGPWSSYGTFAVDVVAEHPGSYSIAGDVLYFGRVATSRTERVVVQAFDSRGFSAVPLSQHTMQLASTSSNVLPYVLQGLPAGTYSIRAFIDLNTNYVLDATESFGVVKDAPTSLCQTNAIAAIVVPTSATHKDLVLRDQDTDNDYLPDAWEVENFGSILAAGPGTVYGSPAYTDSDVDGLNDLDEYMMGSDPRNLDSDGDGVPDGYEFAHGMNPTRDETDSSGLPTSVKSRWDGLVGFVLGADLDPRKVDTDGDGVSDLMEIAAGSDPLRSNSKSAIDIKRIYVDSNGHPVIEWDIHGNARGIKIRYTIEYTEDLRTWASIGSVVSPGTGEGVANVPDTGVRTGKGFYRLRLSYEP